MDYKGENINGTRIMGIELMRLINANSGVLAFLGNKLYFITIEEGKPKVNIKSTPDRAEEDVIFVTDEFDKIKELKRDRIYILVFGTVSIRVIDYRTGEVVLAILGHSFY